MLQLLLLLFFLYRCQGYGIKFQANVDIGDDDLASVLKGFMEQYLKNGETEIDIGDLVQRVQMLASTQPPRVRLVKKDDVEAKKVKTKHHKLSTADKENNEINKPRKDDHENNAKAKDTKKEISNFDEFSDDSREKVDKKSHKLKKETKEVDFGGNIDKEKDIENENMMSHESNKRNNEKKSEEFNDESKNKNGGKDNESKKRHEKNEYDKLIDEINEKASKKDYKSKQRNEKYKTDDFSDDSKEKVVKKTHSSKKTSKKSEPSESPEFSDDSIEKKNHESKITVGKKTKHGKRNSNEANVSKENHPHKISSKKGIRDDNGPKENERTKTDKPESKEKKASGEILSSVEIKKMREKIHIFGTHEGIKHFVYSKIPINNIRV